MTAEERAQAAAIDVEGRQARLAQVLGNSTTGGQDAAIEDTRRRKPAVKGLCVNCGKHFSRHHKHGVEAWCFADHQDDWEFSLQRPLEPAAQVAGALSVEQVEKIRTLMEKREQALAENTKAEQAMLDACTALDTYLDSLTSE